MSTLFVNNLNTASGSTITVPTGKKLVGTDGGAISAPGMVVQQVRYVNISATPIQTSSTSNVATGIKVTITPKASGNKILVQSFLGMVHKQSAGNVEIKLYLDGSQMTGTGVYWGGYMNAGTNTADYSSRVGSLEYTTTNTNALLFELYAKVNDGNNVYIHHGNGSSSLIATEIAG